MVLGKRCLPSLLPVGQKQHDVRRTPQRTVPFMKDVVLKRQEFIAHRETHTRTLLTKPTIPEAFPWEKCRVANHIYPAFKPDSSILLLHFCRHKNCKVTCFFVLSCYYPPWFLYFLSFNHQFCWWASRRCCFRAPNLSWRQNEFAQYCDCEDSYWRLVRMDGGIQFPQSTGVFLLIINGWFMENRWMDDEQGLPP